MSRVRHRAPGLMRSATGITGLVVLVLVVGVAVIGPLFAPHSIAAPIGPPGQGPSAGAPLGTDFLGRDVLSRLLNGGLSVVWIGTLSTVLAYVAGLTVGLVAGYTRTLLDPILMRGVDVMIAFPALLVLLLLVSGLGSHVFVLILGVVLVQLPPIARVMRTLTLETSTRGYVEAAVMRGERTFSVLVREILPNIAPVMLADFGIRFGYSIILIASVNYLGLGLQPPAADWGLMMSENRDFISLNPWAVLAPAVMLALLTIGVNLVADAYVRTLGRSARVAAEPRALPATAITLSSPDPDGVA